MSDALSGLTVAAASIFVLAVVVQFVVQRLKAVYEPIYKKIAQTTEVPGVVDLLVAYFLAVAGALLAGLDILPMLGIHLATPYGPYVGMAVTGLLAATGSDGLHKFLKAVIEGTTPANG